MVDDTGLQLVDSTSYCRDTTLASSHVTGDLELKLFGVTVTLFMGSRSKMCEHLVKIEKIYMSKA